MTFASVRVLSIKNILLLLLHIRNLAGVEHSTGNRVLCNVYTNDILFLLRFYALHCLYIFDLKLLVTNTFKTGNAGNT